MRLQAVQRLQHAHSAILVNVNALWDERNWRCRVSILRTRATEELPRGGCIQPKFVPESGQRRTSCCARLQLITASHLKLWLPLPTVTGNGGKSATITLTRMIPLWTNYAVDIASLSRIARSATRPSAHFTSDFNDSSTRDFTSGVTAAATHAEHQHQAALGTNPCTYAMEMSAHIPKFAVHSLAQHHNGSPLMPL